MIYDRLYRIEIGNRTSGIQDSKLLRTRAEPKQELAKEMMLKKLHWDIKGVNIWWRYGIVT